MHNHAALSSEKTRNGSLTRHNRECAKFPWRLDSAGKRERRGSRSDPEFVRAREVLARHAASFRAELAARMSVGTLTDGWLDSRSRYGCSALSCIRPIPSAHLGSLVLSLARGGSVNSRQSRRWDQRSKSAATRNQARLVGFLSGRGPAQGCGRCRGVPFKPPISLWNPQRRLCRRVPARGEEVWHVAGEPL